MTTGTRAGTTACPFELPGKPPCHGCRADAATEALRQADATMAFSVPLSPFAFDECLSVDGPCCCQHIGASIALDGFTVAEVTRAERVLER